MWESAVGLVTEWCKCLIPFVDHQIGYVVKYKKKLEQLKKKIQELELQRDDVQRLVVEAERNREDINKVVKAWLDKVELALNYDENVTKCCWCSCAIGSRYDLGKKAERKLDDIDELIDDGRIFNRDNIAVPCCVGENPMLSAVNNDQDDFVHFASRDHLRDQIMAALREDGTNLIGVYGMGGVGKTTLVNQVHKQVKELNLFNDVVMAPAISQELVIKKIQNDLAEMLGLYQLKSLGNVVARAEMLSGRLKQGKNLVILDDLWSYVNLSDLGIPCGENCKVIITTRRLEVCKSLGSSINVNVEELSAPDSWHLFIKNLGDLQHYPILETTAREIANECGGLPVALITLGRGLRGKGKSVWDNTLQELRNSEPPNIEEMDVKVYRTIKLSYDYLENDDLRKLFLLCCLFPEDRVIDIAESMTYMLDDDQMFQGRKTLKQMIDKVRTMSARLVDSCLLLGIRDMDGDLIAVSMHDVIRDVAINIASKECDGFHVKASVDIRDWTETKDSLLSSCGTAKCLRLSRMKDEISELQDDCDIQFYDWSVDANESSKVEIAQSYFQRKESLATLDIRETGISLLPSSLSCLVNLKTLYLDGCKFNQPSDISRIGMLKKLEILSLKNCRLRGLPKEIRGLTNLRLLDLEFNNDGFTIPSNVISSLSRLEYLNTRLCKIKWEVEGWGNGKNASLAEVASLRCLSRLYLELSNDDDNEGYIDIFRPTEDPKHGYVKYFLIHFRDTTNNTNRGEINISPPVCHSIKVLIQRVEYLSLIRCPGLKSVGQLGVGFNYLKGIEVKEEVPRLRALSIDNCVDMVSIFESNSGSSIQHLESLNVSWCALLRDVFYLEIGTSSSTLNIEEGLNTDVTFSRLIRMKLIGLVNLEIIWNGHIPLGCFENLEELKVATCPKLTHLFSLSMARNLQNLKELRIYYCNSMVNLISSTEQMVYTHDQEQSRSRLDDLVMFPNLKMLDIRDCGNLKQLWRDQKNLGTVEEDDELGRDELILDFPYLEILRIVRCKNLKRIFLTHQCTQNLKKIVGDSKEWFHQRLAWEDQSDKLRMQPLFKKLNDPYPSCQEDDV